MNLKSNIWKYSLFQFFGSFVIFIPIIVLFWQNNGLDLRQIFILQALYAVITVIMEVPSGYFADVYGRKISLSIGSLAVAAGATAYALSSGFYGFLIAEALWGLGRSFISGADTALIYDSLVDLKRKDDYKKVEGRAQSLGMVSEAAAAIMGGFIGAVSLRLTMYVTIIPYVLLFFVALSLKEPKMHAEIHEKGHLHHIYKIIRFAMHRNKTIKWLILYSSMMYATTLVAFWFYQPYFALAGIPIFYFGFLLAASSLAGALAARYAWLYEKKLGLRNALISLPLICIALYSIMGSFVAVTTSILAIVFMAVRGLRIPIMQDAVNKIVWPQNRATVISIMNLMHRAVFAVFSPFIGWFADVYTIQTALILSGVIVLAGGIITLGMLGYHGVLNAGKA